MRLMASTSTAEISLASRNISCFVLVLKFPIV
nr:MAG TPA: hypothetical protein [Caudoviricetes sp.]